MTHTRLINGRHVMTPSALLLYCDLIIEHLFIILTNYVNIIDDAMKVIVIG